MYIPFIERYQSLNVPTVHNGNSTHRKENHEDLQQKTIMKQGLSLAGTISSVQAEKRGGLSKCSLLNNGANAAFAPQQATKNKRRPNRILSNGANVAFAPQQATKNKRRPNGKNGTKRLRTMEIELGLSKPKRRKISSRGDLMAGFSGVPIKFNVYISSLADKESAGSAISKDGKRRLSTVADQDISLKRRKLNIVEMANHPRTKDLYDFIPQYEGLHVPTTCSKMQE